MKAEFKVLAGGFAAVLAGSGFVLPAKAALVDTYSAAGPDPASIAGEVENFRTALGTFFNIGWDGGAPFEMPADFFNAVVPRGTVFSTPAGSEFRISNPADMSDNEFDTFNAGYPDQFQTFSEPRLFSQLGSSVMDVDFFVAGETTPGLTNGFGVVFTDVDLPDVTKLEYYDVQGNLLEEAYATPASQGLSFLGLLFDAAEVASVRITTGNGILGDDDDPELGSDIVVMDDFILGEPQPVPVPAALPLFAAAGGVLGLLGWRARRSVRHDAG